MGEELTTECLYYRTFRSFLLQNSDFKTDFILLRRQQDAFPDSFKILTEKDQTRYKQMQSAFYTGRFSLFEGNTIDFSNIPLPEIEKSDITHKELVAEIYKNRTLTLEPYTGPIQEACPEYPVYFGSIDLMIRSGSCAYIVEVKTDTADHAIVGQVMKYYVGMSLQLVLKFFDEVKIITICPGYDQAAYNGLRQLGAAILLLDHKSMKISTL